MIDAIEQPPDTEVWEPWQPRVGQRIWARYSTEVPLCPACGGRPGGGDFADGQSRARRRGTVVEVYATAVPALSWCCNTIVTLPGYRFVVRVDGDWRGTTRLYPAILLEPLEALEC